MVNVTLHSSTPAQKKCADRFIELRNDIEEKCKNIISASNVDNATKQLVADLSAQFIYYIQEFSVATYDYCVETNNDRRN